MAQELVLLTPEKTIVSFRIAGLGSRAVAHLVDLILWALVLFTLTFLISFLSVFDYIVGSLAGAFLMMLPILGTFLFFILFEGLWNGQTVGKKMMGIRVRKLDGTGITFGNALARNLLRPADFFPGTYFIGMLSMVTSPTSQRLGDMVAGTIVVYDKRPEATFRVAPHAINEHPLEAVVGDLRGMTRAEYDALRLFCDRYPELPLRAQMQFMDEVWIPIALKLGIERPPNIHPLYFAEAVVMKYGRIHGLL
ncbi:MAG: RDD family protein [Fimbriimonadaceae bacterium]|nr:RDD family protein [Fimbriimonadaceae bacterium]NUM38313.1 RDD family protein [Armatimonadota bacterium]